MYVLCRVSLIFHTNVYVQMDDAVLLPPVPKHTSYEPVCGCTDPQHKKWNVVITVVVWLTSCEAKITTECQGYAQSL